MMPLKTFLKNLKRKHVLTSLMPVGFAFLLASCASGISTATIEKDCGAIHEAFVPYADCLVQTYESVPEEERGPYDDLDKYFIDQARFLIDEVNNARMSENEAQLSLSRARMEAESQRRERNAYYDRRSGFGLGVGIGHGHTGYYGRYGF